MIRSTGLSKHSSIFVAWLLCSGFALGRDWYVDDNGSGHGDGSQGNPFKSIGKALSVAADGDRILVAPGTYSELLDVAKSVTILGDTGGGTIVDGAFTGRVVTIEAGKTVWLSDLTIKNGDSAHGSGIENLGTTIAVRCHVTACSAFMFTGSSPVTAYGGGIDSSGTLEMYECAVDACAVSFSLGLFSNNLSVSGFGGGIYSSGTLKMFSCTVSANTCQTLDILLDQPGNAASGGGIYSSGNLRLVNCTISGNSVSAPIASGGGVDSDVVPAVLEHTTIADNSAYARILFISAYAFGGGFKGTATTSQSIVADNTATVRDSFNDFAFGPDFDGTCDSGGYVFIGDTTDTTFTGDNTGNQTGDPLLLPLADNGGHVLTHALASGSPCIDAGNPDPLASPAYDARDYPRALWDPSVGVNDIGAYESGGLPSFLLTATPDAPLPAGASLVLVTGGGIGFDPVLLALVDANGTPTFVPVLFTKFDQSGILWLPGTVPSGLSGLTFGLRSYSLDATGHVIHTNEETLVFQ